MSLPESPPLAPLRVLIADDEPGTLQLMAEMLGYNGYEVLQARDGLEALVRARETTPAIALLDVMMPGLDGREVCRRMRADAALRAVPVIMISVADEADVDWRGAGAVAFLQKPFAMKKLTEIVQHYLPRGGPSHEG